MAFGIDDAIAAGLKIVDKFIPDPEAKIKAEADLRNSLQQWDQSQAHVFEQEAASRNVFVAGWRPFIGWTCGSAFAWSYFLMPVCNFILGALGHPLVNVSFDMNTLTSVMYGLLGLGGLRTFEKIKGVAK